MKIINRGRIFEILRRHFFIDSLVYICLIGLAILSQENLQRFVEFMPPELAGLKIVSISLFILLIMFVFFSISVGLHLYKVLSTEYIRVWDNFIEGPNEKGERVVLSFSQITYIGMDLLGRFSLDAGDSKVVLPGKLTVSRARNLSRLISSARLKDNL